MKRQLVLTLPFLLSVACGDASTIDTDSAGDTTSEGDGDGDPTTGDGDGDPTTGEGDGDGDPTTGDGDGDPTTGDGDGDPTTGDGDGDPTTGDGDGDPGPVCGDGTVDDGEECDEGPDNADDALCTSSCVSATCGDGLVYAGVEACDDSGESADCNADCTASTCGDGVLNLTAGEVCDTDAGDQTCADEGFDGGTLACDAVTCDYDDSACYVPFAGVFTNCGKTGHLGPDQPACDFAYTDTSLAGGVSVTAGYQTWVVPYTATYSIEVWGAQGGTHTYGVGGNGARVKGNFDLVQGDTLKILVGQQGKDGGAYDVGGGGGSYVALDDNTPLIIAGGGGGAGNCGLPNFAIMIGKWALGDGNGGIGSNDGTWCGCGGAGSPGGGFLTDGMPAGGDAFVNGGAGDDTERPGQCVDSGIGGFGGGGNGGNGGGGGGGYAGGNGGGLNNVASGVGGESYNDGANPEGEDGVRTGHGEVHITLLAP